MRRLPRTTTDREVAQIDPKGPRWNDLCDFTDLVGGETLGGSGRVGGGETLGGSAAETQRALIDSRARASSVVSGGRCISRARSAARDTSSSLRSTGRPLA